MIKLLKLYTLILAVLFMGCSDILGYEDPDVTLEPEQITGEWLRVTETPSDVPGLYKKDTVIYQIGLDKLTDYLKFVDKSIYEPLTFKIIYPKGGTSYGYIERPDEHYRDFDTDRQEAILNYKLYQGLPATPTLTCWIAFSVPRNHPADTLRVKTDNETFGLKKKERP